MPLTLYKTFREQIGFQSKPERLLFCCILLGAFLVIHWSAPLIAVPYQIDYGEGLLLDGAMRILHSQPLYPNPFAFPVVIHVYGPVAYAATAAVLPGGIASFPAGRLLIVTLCIVLSSIITIILRRTTGSWGIGFSFGLLLLTLPAFRFWLYLLRADVIGIVFSMIGVALYLSNEKRWFWSIPFFGLALFCKYSLLAAPIAVFADLMWKRKFRHAAIFGVGLGGVSALAFTVFQIKTHGWFAFHMFSSHPDRYSLFQFFALGALVWASAPAVTALAAWYVITELGVGKCSFASIYFATSSVCSLSAGKLGSTTNHFIEWMVACCICAGLGFSLLQKKHRARALSAAILLSASVLIGVVAQDRPSLQPAREFAGCGGAYDYVRNSPTPSVLSESLGPLLAAGKPVLVSDPFEYGQFVQRGWWPDRRVEELINEHYFGLIVMGSDPFQRDIRNSDRWPEPLLGAILRNYRVVDRFTCRDAGVLLEPAPDSPSH